MNNIKTLQERSPRRERGNQNGHEVKKKRRSLKFRKSLPSFQGNTLSKIRNMNPQG